MAPSFELAGVIIGVRIAHAVPVVLLKRCIAWICISMAVLMIVQTFAS